MKVVARFTAKIRAYKYVKKGKVYKRFILHIPTKVGKILDENKEYLIEIKELK